MGKKRLAISESYGTITTPWDKDPALGVVKPPDPCFDPYGIITQWTGQLLVDYRRWQTPQKGSKSVVDHREWYEHVGISFNTTKITVYIPKGEYGELSVKSNTGNVEIPKDFQFESIDISERTGNVTSYASASDAVKIQTSTGNICVESISAGALELSVSTGKIAVADVSCGGNVKVKVFTGKTELTDLVCENVISSGSTGDIALKNVIAAQKISVERSTGDVKLDECDAAEILIETDTGDVTGTLLSEKVFIVETDTGSTDVPKTVTGGRCEITTDTGDIRIDIQQ